MTPSQLVRQCLTFWEGQIELAHIDKVGAAESFASDTSQVFGNVCDKLLSITCFCVAALFKLYDISACQPVGFEQFGIDGYGRFALRFIPQIRDMCNKSHIFSVVGLMRSDVSLVTSLFISYIIFLSD